MKNKIPILLLASISMLPGLAQAVAPANSTLTNTATLTYTGLATPITATVDITVNLTATAPTLSVPADSTVAENQDATYPYTITSTANGSDAYNLSAAAPVLSNVTGAPTVTFNQGGPDVTSVILGASAASATQTAGNTVISVPSDGTADSAINNITAGDTVVIGGTAYIVASVTDDGTNGTITLTTPLAANINQGDLIAEQQTFNMVVNDAGTVTVSGTPATLDVTITAAASSGANPSSDDLTVTTLVEVTFDKYVRNTSNPNGAPVAITFGGNNFFATAGTVTAVQGDVLEYLIQVTAPAGTTLTGAQFADVLPPFTTYVANSTQLNGSATGAADAGANSPLIGGLLVNDAGSAVNSGTIAAGTTASATLQVTVD